MVRQPEIIVRAEVEHILAVHHDVTVHDELVLEVREDAADEIDRTGHIPEPLVLGLMRRQGTKFRRI